MCAREKGSEEAEAEKKREKEEAGEAATYGNHENPQTTIQILTTGIDFLKTRLPQC